MTVTETTTRMLDTYPRTFNVDQDALVECIAACLDCAQACTQCADDCLSEDGRRQDLAKCIRLNMDCADVCATTARIVSRQTDYDANVTRAMLTACATACRTCGDECASHAEHMEHCAVCAERCRTCEAACERLLEAIG